MVATGSRRVGVAGTALRACAALLLALPALSSDAAVERGDKWEMSVGDMEFVAHAISCGKRLYADGQRAAAWPYLELGARHGDIDSQYIAAGMLGTGEQVPQDWNAAVGWLGAAADGNIKPMAKRRLRETRKALCGGRAECEQDFDAIVDDYRRRFGRDASGMACRQSKGQQGRGVSSLRVNRGSRTVECRFARLLPARGVLRDAELQDAMGGGDFVPTRDPAGSDGLVLAYPDWQEFTVRAPNRRGETQIRCPDLGAAGDNGEEG